MNKYFLYGIATAVLVCLLNISLGLTGFEYFYAGVSKGNDIFTIFLFNGVIALFIMMSISNITNDITMFGYIYILNGGLNKFINSLIKRSYKNIILSFIGYMLVSIILYITNVPLLETIYIFIIYAINLLIILLWMIILEHRFGMNISLVLNLGFNLFMSIITAYIPMLFYPLNYTMYYRNTDILFLPIVLSIIYLIISYVLLINSFKNREVL